MKFVGLLSGGKDSCYNIMKCTEYGHELICLGNLMPPESHVGDEMNSFMYQSAAHTAIPGMAVCFGVPLVRQEIQRTSVVQSLDYEANDTDEVEDMYQLLNRIKTEYPDIKGVSCGAIVSNYQRHRVEDVCARLGLVPLTYLWQKDRSLLLNEIIEAGVDAVLVKVAGAGLDPYKHLGKSLKSLQPTLLQLRDRFGLDPCGEGGEYESLVLDCPAFKTVRLQLTETQIVPDDEDPRYELAHHSIKQYKTTL
jgi:diphthine-ammonia ligase